ncbi:MAG TPA: hypothetical protein VHC97_22300 [Thermoanaerobaculia bacterium]|jgi:hypothetical protein|nr:hypothetical protein [Thermoanaerobaculia bacterium]
MRNLKKLLLAAALIAAAVASAPAKSEAVDRWCETCAASGYTHCYSCCRCNGGTSSYCIEICGGT